MKKKSLLKRIFTSIIIAFIFILAICAYIGYKIWFPLGGNVEKIFKVKNGANLTQVAVNLESEKLISNAFYFNLYVDDFKNADTELQAGQYLLNSQMNIPQIAEILIKGEVSIKKITVPEGFNLKQIAKRLAKEGIVEEEEFQEVSSLYNPNYSFLKDKPQNASLEGFLFPDTYIFYKNSSTEEVIDKFLDNFDTKLNQELRDEIKKQNKTIFDIITLASIVEKEVSTNEDQKIVAGIFYTRLKNGIPLQSDATVNYITGKSKRQPSLEDTKIDSPYNTYKNKGLPIGPICNPGISAIKAVIYPKQTDFLYFLSPEQGPTIFSKTAEEHQANKKKYLDN